MSASHRDDTEFTQAILHAKTHRIQQGEKKRRDVFISYVMAALLTGICALLVVVYSKQEFRNIRTRDVLVSIKRLSSQFEYRKDSFRYYVKFTPKDEGSRKAISLTIEGFNKRDYGAKIIAE